MDVPRQGRHLSPLSDAGEHRLAFDDAATGFDVRRHGRARAASSWKPGCCRPIPAASSEPPRCPDPATGHWRSSSRRADRAPGHWRSFSRRAALAPGHWCRFLSCADGAAGDWRRLSRRADPARGHWRMFSHRADRATGYRCGFSRARESHSGPTVSPVARHDQEQRSQEQALAAAHNGPPPHRFSTETARAPAAARAAVRA